MAKQRKINSNTAHDSVHSEFPAVQKALKSFKKLSSEEVTVFIEILKKKRVGIDHIKEIIKAKGLKCTTTKPYAILKNLIDASLIFNRKGTRTYDSVHPRDLLIDIQDSIKELDNEIAEIEQHEPEIMSQLAEPADLLVNDFETITLIRSLIEKGYKAEFYHNELSIKPTDDIYKKITKNLELQPSKGKFSAVFLTKDGEALTPRIVILFSRHHDLDQKAKVIGNKVIDPETCKCLREVVK